jgi:flavodoxin
MHFSPQTKTIQYLYEKRPLVCSSATSQMTHQRWMRSGKLVRTLELAIKAWSVAKSLPSVIMSFIGCGNQSWFAERMSETFIEFFCSKKHQLDKKIYTIVRD